MFCLVTRVTHTLVMVRKWEPYHLLVKLFSTLFLVFKLCAKLNWWSTGNKCTWYTLL